jgi:L-ascorbate 6-phosphate lactonase
MIEPVRQGQELLEEITNTTPPPGALAVWWLGQSGYVIKSRIGTLAVDLYLSEHLTKKYAATNRPHVRMTRAPLRGHELPELDLVLASHKHSDHFDPETLPTLLARRRTWLVIPEAIRHHALDLGLPEEQIAGLVAGQTFERAGFRIRAVAGAHEGLDTDLSGRHLYLGYVVESEGLRVYHSGDTLAYQGLAESLGRSPFDVLFLPINGRDPSRGVAGNMTAIEAVELAGRLRPRFVVPHHYDMFTFNTVPVEQFIEEARRLPPEVCFQVLRCGERWEISG